ncbi:MAG: FecR domain-containing protein [Oscillatoriales cyanobacterium C42_A2020_001]|nr:FecR domain-containing protein [Leptolyngbyaceae cyanobacterium C42_A2020_001]
MKSPIAIGLITLGIISVLALTNSYAQQTLPVRVDRGLEVRSLVGQVNRLQKAGVKPARVGDLLQVIGDGVATSKGAKAILFVDTGIGVVDVAENTNLVVQELSFAPDNGRITRLFVSQGQARLRVRPFTHRGSKLEIRTPVGLSGVRGTDFGIAIQPNGKTGLAVMEGQVASAALGKEVGVAGGFQNFTLPNEPPSAPVPLRNDTRLTYSFERVIQGGIRKVQLIGQVDPVNAVQVNGIPQVTDRTGRFKAALEFFPPPTFQVLVQTPLGKEQRYDLVFR